jgi:hypothetical protein
MIKLRTLTPSDILTLDTLWREHWSHESSLPGLESRIIDAVAVDESGRVVGYGQVRLFAEAMLFLDPTVRKRDRAAATRLLMHEAFRGTDLAGIKDIYCFIRDPDFSLLIQKHFSFDRVDNPGELLLRRL